MALISTTTGNVYQQTKRDFDSGIPPSDSELLSETDLFTIFWKELRQKIFTAGNNDCRLLLDAYTSIYTGNTGWANGLTFVEHGACLQEVADIIQDHPPDVIIHDVGDVYGYHRREPDRWKYICISKQWINEWRQAMGFKPDRRLALGLEAVIRATLVHELAHWLFTLVSSLAYNLPFFWNFISFSHPP